MVTQGLPIAQMPPARASTVRHMDTRSAGNRANREMWRVVMALLVAFVLGLAAIAHAVASSAPVNIATHTDSGHSHSLAGESGGHGAAHDEHTHELVVLLGPVSRSAPAPVAHLPLHSRLLPPEPPPVPHRPPILTMP